MWTDFSYGKNPDCIQVHKDYLAAGKDSKTLNVRITPLMPYKLKDVIYVHSQTVNYPGLVNLESTLYPLEYFTFFNVQNECIISRYRFISPETRRLATLGEDWELNFWNTTLVDGTEFSILLEEIHIDDISGEGKLEYENFITHLAERYNSFPIR